MDTNTYEQIMLDENEYIYLSEHFEVMDAEHCEIMPKYIVSEKRKNLEKTIKAAIKNELNPLQQEIITERYFERLSVTEIAENHSMSRTAVYRVLNLSQKKLYDCLKYVYICGFSLLCPPKNFDEMLKGEFYENHLN